MEFRHAKDSDNKGIMEIISQAQAYFKAQGIDQWQNNYPNPEAVKKDIDGLNGYVLHKDQTLAATVAVSFDGEKTYDRIYDGKWITEGQYAVIHRLAVDSRYKGSGLSAVILENIEKMCRERDIRSIRVDTHEDNRSMQRMLQKNGFQYCGVIFLMDGNKRIAFEKVL